MQPDTISRGPTLYYSKMSNVVLLLIAKGSITEAKWLFVLKAPDTPPKKKRKMSTEACAGMSAATKAR